MTFSFGNTVEYDKEGRPSRDGTKVNHYRWIAFVIANELREESDLIIKKVTYNLHKTFSPNKVEVETAPFIISYIGWGTFEIVIEIEF